MTASTHPHPLCTIGYERDTVDGLIARLREARVDVVVDVRAIAASRRPGFSKTVLAESLAEAGVDYVHLRALGTPKAGREAARAGRSAQMQAIYRQHLAEPETIAALGQAMTIAQDRRAALLCLEADARCCHRAIVAEEIRRSLHCQIVDL